MDMEVICAGILIIAFAFGAVIWVKHSLTPPLNLREYKEAVSKEFVKRGFSPDYMNEMSERKWEEYKNEGLTPAEAVGEWLM